MESMESSVIKDLPKQLAQKVSQGNYHTVNNYLVAWPKNPLSISWKIKDIFFIFTNNFIDLDILFGVFFLIIVQG